MKNNQVLAVLFCFFIFNLSAQFIDDMESYIDGQPISENHWTDWSCGGGPGCAIMSTSAQALSGTLSGLIPNDLTTDAVLDLGNKIFGEWSLIFHMYVPSNKEAYWNIACAIPNGNCEPVAHFYFNESNSSPGIGYIGNIPNSPIMFDFPHDQWFQIVLNVDISAGIMNSTWELGIDGVVVVPAGTPFTDENGVYPPSLGGIEFFSFSTFTEYYLDDLCYSSFIVSCNLGVIDTENNNFSAHPNPVKDMLFLNAEREVTSISIYNILGQEVYTSSIISKTFEINMSTYDAGIYFVKALIENSIKTLKIIR